MQGEWELTLRQASRFAQGSAGGDEWVSAGRGEGRVRVRRADLGRVVQTLQERERERVSKVMQCNAVKVSLLSRYRRD